MTVAVEEFILALQRGKVVTVVEEFWSLGEVSGVDRPDPWEELLSKTHLPRSVWAPQQQRDQNYEAWVRRQWIDDLALVGCECGPCAGSRGRAELSGTDGEYVAVLITRSGSETVAQEGAEAPRH